MMTILPSELSDLELTADRRQQFDSRPDIGPMTGIAERLARYLEGDPVSYKLATSTSFAVFTTLPDEPRARVAVCTVFGAPCFYRTDGTQPAINNDQQLPIGAIITLWGQPTIKGFIFAAIGLVASNLAINYYD